MLSVLRLAAQGQPTAPIEPASKDPKSVVFLAANALGMLRGLQQEDSITTLEFWGAGTVHDGRRTVQASSYRASIRFRLVPGMRVDFTARAANEPPQRQIHVVAGRFAWNETEPGVNATTVTPQAARDRQLLLASLPQSVVKQAAGAGGELAVSYEGLNTVLTFPLPALSGTTLSATLNGRSLIERVVTRGELVSETTFADYADWNERGYKADILFPRRIVHTRGGVNVLDLTVTKTNTYNPYVIMPVPENIEKSAGGSP
jgi:hypothetical protein